MGVRHYLETINSIKGKLQLLCHQCFPGMPSVINRLRFPFKPRSEQICCKKLCINWSLNLKSLSGILHDKLCAEPPLQQLAGPGRVCSCAAVELRHILAYCHGHGSQSTAPRYAAKTPGHTLITDSILDMDMTGPWGQPVHGGAGIFRNL